MSQLITLQCKKTTQPNNDDANTINLMSPNFIQLFSNMVKNDEQEYKVQGKRPGTQKLLFRIVLFVLHRINVDSKLAKEADQIFKSVMCKRCNLTRKQCINLVDPSTEPEEVNEKNFSNICKAYTALIQDLQQKKKTGLLKWSNTGHIDNKLFHQLLTQTTKQSAAKTKEDFKKLSREGKKLHRDNSIKYGDYKIWQGTQVEPTNGGIYLYALKLFDRKAEKGQQHVKFLGYDTRANKKGTRKNKVTRTMMILDAKTFDMENPQSYGKDNKQGSSTSNIQSRPYYTDELSDKEHTMIQAMVRPDQHITDKKTKDKIDTLEVLYKAYQQLNKNT